MEQIYQKAALSNVPAQTNVSKNSIIWQCLYVLQTVSEFKNLSYRVTKTWNDLEVIMVYRDEALGIFGPALDPITLVIDQKGKCLLYIPFKPVQRVSIISTDLDHVEFSSLLAVLRMIAGKGYMFCPGLPEKFLTGKACAKFVVLHKVPFKRYQSALCPVYYQTQVNQQKSAKSSLCALCPRCMQAAKWIQSLSNLNQNDPGKTQSLVSGPLKADQKSIVLKNSLSNNTFTGGKECTTVFKGIANLTSIQDYHSSGQLFTARPQSLNIPLGPTRNDEKVSNLDINGNSQTGDKMQDSKHSLEKTPRTEDIKSSLNTKIQEKRSFLRNILQNKSIKDMSISDQIPERKDLKISSEDTNKLLNNIRFKKLQKRHKNSCRLCRKEFSTPASLMNHFQRHEALSSTWSKQYKKLRLARNYKIRFQGFKLSSSLLEKKSFNLSKTSLRLILRYLDDLILSINGTEPLSPQKKVIDKCGNDSNEAEKKVELKQEKLQTFVCEQGNEAQGKQYDLKRDYSCLSPMQTLLKAAIIADTDNHVTSPTISSSSSLVLGKHPETAVVSSTTQSSPCQLELTEANIPEKKARKSLRLASKKNKTDNINAEDDHKEMSILKNEALSDGSYSQINNFLHSTFNTNDVQVYAQPPALVTYPLPTSLYSNIKTYAANLPTSDFTIAGNHQKMINNSQNTFNVSAVPGREPLVNTSFSSYSEPSRLPHQFVETNPSHYHLTQKGHDQPQSVSTASLLTGKMEENTSSSFGAIDLSKPKSAQIVPPILSFSEIKPNLNTFTNLSHNIIQSDTSNRHAFLQYLMMVNKNTDSTSQGYKESLMQNSVDSNKQADPNLQPQFFGITQNKIDKGIKNTSHVQSMVTASSGRSKAKKTSYGKDGQSEEIQCGCKWTGSGGLVKERTQVVRELVPPHVMANILSKPLTPATATQPISINLYKNSQPLLNLLPVSPSKYIQPSQFKPQDISSLDHALNLSVKKPIEVQVTNKDLSIISQKPNDNYARSSQSPAHKFAPVSSTFSGISILKPLMSNSLKTESQHVLTIPAPTNAQAHPIASKFHKMRHKSALLAESSKLSSPPLSTTATTPSYTISSPSLAAMLLQPALAKTKSGNSDTINYTGQSLASPKLLKNKNFIYDMSLSPTRSIVKIEPMDSHIHEQDVTLTPTKTEGCAPNNSDYVDNPDDDESPPKLVMDINPETLSNKGKKTTLKLEAHTISKAADFVSNNSYLKCDH